MDHEVTRVGLPMYYCCCCPSASACIFFPVERVCVAHRLVDICASPTSVSTLLRLHRSASRIFGLITRSSARLQRLLQPIFIEHVSTPSSSGLAAFVVFIAVRVLTTSSSTLVIVSRSGSSSSTSSIAAASPSCHCRCSRPVVQLHIHGY
uniref:Uncharacterized protein n=1 Tax=Oryza barthii TaxID=65489 RepID=A0A0D3GGY0_9ORYZ